MFVILTAYIDESGTHKGSPVTMMAGFMGTANKWVRFSREYSKLRKRYGFSIFHAKDLRSRAGEFRGWKPEKCMALANDFFYVIDDLSIGFAVALSDADYQAHYLAGEKPKKLPQETLYGVCFRATAAFLMDQAAHRQRGGPDASPPEHSVNFVLESGHKHAGDAVRIFDYLKTRLPPEQRTIMGGISFDTKENCPELHAADFLAYSTFMQERQSFEPNGTRRPMKSPTAPSNIWRVPVGPEQLRNLKEQLLEWDAERLRLGRSKTISAALEQSP